MRNNREIYKLQVMSINECDENHNVFDYQNYRSNHEPKLDRLTPHN